MQLDLSTRHGRLKASFPDPAGFMRLPEFVLNLFPLEERLVSMGVKAALDGGRKISCRAGCGACCRQPVPVSLPEAFLLYEMLAGQPDEKKKIVLSRFEAARERLQEHGFADRSLQSDAETGAVVGLALDYFKLNIPCPFLEAESCSIHTHRPMSCREHLVTSPADLCKIPDHPEIRGIDASVSLTQSFALLYAGLAQEPPMILPLPLALEYASERNEMRKRRYEAKSLFTAFFSILENLLPSEPG